MSDAERIAFVAVRAWTKRRRNEDPKQLGKPQPRWPRCETAVIVDCETTVDAAQLLNFGVYRMVRFERKFPVLSVEQASELLNKGIPLPKPKQGEDWRGIMMKHVTEGLFYGNDLPERDPAGVATLQTYAEQHGLELISAAEFIKRVLLPSCARRPYALVCGFNLPFDLSRLALPGEWGKARRGRRKAGRLERATQAGTYLFSGAGELAGGVGRE